MALSEFDLIKRFFTRRTDQHAVVRVGIGDDCAVLRLSEASELAVTTDTLVEGVHFSRGADPESLGYKALAVNLSDLAAMGAEPLCVSLALALPVADGAWLARFAKGFFALADIWSLPLIGGDTTRGPLTITVQAFGGVPEGAALLRSTARVGDHIYVSGLLGDAALALKIERGKTLSRGDASVLERLHRPRPRLEAGLRLRGLATSCIDLSDGLVGDLGHILHASGVGATVEWNRLPLSTAVRRYIRDTGDWKLPLRGGEDYELCFTVSPSEVGGLHRRLSGSSCSFACIGMIERSAGLRVLKGGSSIDVIPQSYEHFS